MRKNIFSLFSFVILAACNNQDTGKQETTTTTPVTDNAPVLINYSVVNAFPHDTTSYT